ncbi:MAG TPA: DinB family protein [Anaerolineales bacterium]|nr:DinB family protein [Anaerolineales bacterium]
MAHPLVDQLRFTRSEWQRGLEGLSEEDGAKHFGQMNCIGWIVGHLAWQEQRYWLDRAQGKVLFPQMQGLFAGDAPMSTPSFKEVLEIWKAVTKASDPFLDSLTTEGLLAELLYQGKPIGQSLGSEMRRITYHYWYHTGEIQSIRQMLGQKNLPDYVGEIEKEAPYRPEKN